MAKMMHPKNNSNTASPLSPLSVNLHHRPLPKRQEPIDLFSPKGRTLRRHSVPHRRSEASRATHSCPSPVVVLPPKKSGTHNPVVVPIMLRLRRMKRRLLHEHTKDYQSEMASSSPTNRNL